jgi:hypothetical protein
MMKHVSEEDLLAYRDGESSEREAITTHLRECAECRHAMEKLNAVFEAMQALPVPDPGEEYGARVWSRIEPRLGEKKASWWQTWFLPQQRWVALAGVAALIAMAFVLGRWTRGPVVPGVEGTDAAKVRERVLVVAVGEHLGRTEMVLMELANAPVPEKGQKAVDISSTQKRAEDLVEENRLYRQTALHEGDQAMASTLDELERVLLDIANSPDELTPAQFEAIQKRIEEQGILFKVRVVKQGLDERKKQPAQTAPATSGNSMERKKA